MTARMNHPQKKDDLACQSRVLFVTLGDPHNTPDRDIVVCLRQAGFYCQQQVMPYRKRWKRLIEASWAARRVRDYDVVITNEYNNAFVFALVGLCFRKKIKNIVIGMNLSSRALKTGISFIDRAINIVFKRFARIIVHSREEIDLFVQLHGIPREKFLFSSWGFDAPVAAGPTSNFNADTPPYFCMVGRNNRDFETFLTALKNCDVDGVIVCAPDERFVMPTTSRLRVFHDLSMEECAACVRYSLGNVVLVKDADRGAGHITAVMGMHFAKPHIFTDVPTLRDYLVSGDHGIGVKLGDATEVTAAMKRLLSDADLAKSFGANGQRDADRFHSHAAAQNRILRIITDELNS